MVYGSMLSVVDQLRQLAWDDLSASNEEVNKIRLYLSNLGAYDGAWAQLMQQVAEDWLFERPDEDERRLPDGMFLEILND